MNRVLKKLLVTTGVTGAVLAGAELWLRTRVPHCGVTPFRVSEVPGLASEFRPGFTTLYKGFETSFNSDGYRGPEFPAREEGVLRVALVGDSFTYGTAVAFEDTLGEQLERELAARGVPAQVLNFGVPGYGAQNVAAVVEHRALPLDPDVVLYVFYSNDVDPPSEWEEIPPDAVIDGMYGFPLHSALAQWANVMVKRVALKLGRQLARRTPEYSRQSYTEGGGERVRDALGRMTAACADADVRFAMAVFPHLTRVDLNPFRPIDELALADARALGIEALDLVAAFPGETDLSGYWASVFDSHPSPEGHAKVARYLAETLWPR